MSLFIRPEVRKFSAYVAGLSIDEIRQKYGLEQVIKLASNENPLGASPMVQETVAKHAGLVFRYPQSGNPRLRAALASKYGVNADRIVAGDGSDEMIDLLFRVCATPGVHNAVAFRPCFEMYRTQAALCGVELRQADLNPDMSFPWEKLLSLVDDHTALVFVTSPDNPSGRAATHQELLDLVARLPETCLLILDEAYVDFADAPISLLPDLKTGPLSERVGLLRTFSKLYGMAGLRLGYGILPTEVAEYMWRVRLPFSVNLLAEEAALTALEDQAFREATLAVIRSGRVMLSREFAALGFNVFPSQANFIMVESPQGIDTAQLFENLLRQGVIVRPLNGYHMPNRLRITVGTESENRFLIAALKKILH